MCACVRGHGVERGALAVCVEGGSAQLLPRVFRERAAAQCQLVRLSTRPATTTPSLRPPPRAIELANSLDDEGGVEVVPPTHSPQLRGELTQYYHGLSLHRLGEFRRAAHVLADCLSPEAFFLRCYALYLVSVHCVLSSEILCRTRLFRLERNRRKMRKWMQ